MLEEPLTELGDFRLCYNIVTTNDELYRADADAQGAGFVEVQHALLIATLAQRPQMRW